MKRHTSRVAVTLVEMLVVLAIVLLLAGLVAVAFSRLGGQGKEKAVTNTLTLLDAALAEYREEAGRFPEQPVRGTTDPNEAIRHNQTMVEALESEVGSRHVLGMIDRRFVRNEWPAGAPDRFVEVYDPWDRPIDYEWSTEDGFPLLRSAGPDRSYQTGDDLTNR